MCFWFFYSFELQACCLLHLDLSWSCVVWLGCGWLIRLRRKLVVCTRETCCAKEISPTYQSSKTPSTGATTRAAIIYFYYFNSNGCTNDNAHEIFDFIAHRKQQNQTSPYNQLNQSHNKTNSKKNNNNNNNNSSNYNGDDEDRNNLTSNSKSSKIQNHLQQTTNNKQQTNRQQTTNTRLYLYSFNANGLTTTKASEILNAIAKQRQVLTSKQHRVVVPST